MAAMSCNDVESHKGWINDLKYYTDGKLSFPIVADPKREVAVKLGMIDPEEKDKDGMPLTARAVSSLLPYAIDIFNFVLLFGFIYKSL